LLWRFERGGTTDRRKGAYVFANLGWTEILILGGALFLLFGAKRFPEVGRSLGKGINNLYRGITGKLDDDPAELPKPSSDKLVS
jgi:sec-independent protein translocase protein TatA